MDITTTSFTQLPLISIIIPAYNMEKYIAECLNSILAQTFLDWEAICIDDGSTDKSLSIFRQYAERDRRIRVITQNNRGACTARNNAISMAKGEFIFPLDSNDMIMPTCLETLYKVITTTNNVAVCPLGHWFVDGKLKPLHMDKPTAENMYSWKNMLHNSMMYSKKFWEKYGGYDERFCDLGAEDFDFFLNFVDDHQLICQVEGDLFVFRIKSEITFSPPPPPPNFPLKNKITFDSEITSDLKKTMFAKRPIMRLFHNDMEIIHNRVANGSILTLFSVLPILKINYEKNKTILRLFNFLPLLQIKYGQYKTLYHLFGFFPICAIIHGDKPKKDKNTLGLCYYKNTYNFGDILNLDLARYFGVNKTTNENPYHCDAVFIGSLLQEFLSNNCFSFTKLFRPAVKIWGTGFIREQKCAKERLIRRVKVYAVRGYMSLDRLKKITRQPLTEVAIGDPGLLCRELVNTDRIEKKYDLGIIPHYVDKNNPLLSRIKVKNSIVIDIQQSSRSFIEKVAECKYIISSAMHGLITADSLGIPNVRMILSDKIVGGDYKFDDYYSAFGNEKHDKIRLNEQDFTNADLVKMTCVPREKVDKICADLIATFPYGGKYSKQPN
ncbi:MAG: glycosyltransferase [Rickettsiales bacterium]|nr:glycosyltransferase [Rickettsiales bacterium]